MAKYLYLWEVDMSKAPVDPKERGAAWGILLDLVTRDMERGITKEWGSFVGESAGYFVAEGTEVEVALAIQQYVPYVRFKGHAIASLAQVKELTQKLQG